MNINLWKHQQYAIQSITESKRSISGNVKFMKKNIIPMLKKNVWTFATATQKYFARRHVHESKTQKSLISQRRGSASGCGKVCSQPVASLPSARKTYFLWKIDIFHFSS